MNTRIKHEVMLLCGFLFLSNGTHAANPPLGEITVEEAVTEALANNKDLAVLRWEVDLNRAEWIKAKTIPFNPEIEAGLERGGDGYSSNEEKSTHYGVSQELELFGQRGRRKAAARYRWDMAKARVQRGERVLASDVSTGFQKLLYLEKRAAVLKEVSGFDKEVRDAAKARFQEERISRLDFDLVQIEYDRSHAEFLETQSELKQEALTFVRLLGRNPDEEVRPKGDFDFTPSRLVLEKLEPFALRHRKDYLETNLEAKAAKEDLSLAKRERLPNPTIGLELSQETGVIEGTDIVGTPAITSGIDRIEDKEKRAGLSLSFPLPLFNRNQGEVARAKAGVRVSQSSLDNLRNEIQTEVRQVYDRLQTAEEVVALFQTVEPRLSKDLALVRKAYQEGRIPIENYLTQKDHFVKARLDYLEALNRYFSARSDLEKAIGAPLEKVME